MSGGWFHYRLFGLAVASRHALPELEPVAPEPPEVVIDSGPVAPLAGDARVFRRYSRTPAGDVLHFAWVGRFRVEGPSRITLDLDGDFDTSLLGLPLLGPVFGVLLHRRGDLVLHGSAIGLGGRAHVFLGDKGAGKSTTAASLVASGARLISDDVVVLRCVEGEWQVVPSYPAMKLDPRLLPVFGEGGYTQIDPDALDLGKRRVRVAHVSGPVPLGPVHALGRGPRHAVAALDRAATLHALIRFSYYPRLGGDALSPAETADLFRRASALARDAQVRRLTVKDGLDTLRDIRALLMEAL